jgi:hypothetical protein
VTGKMRSSIDKKVNGKVCVRCYQRMKKGVPLIDPEEAAAEKKPPEKKSRLNPGHGKNGETLPVVLPVAPPKPAPGPKPQPVREPKPFAEPAGPASGKNEEKKDPKKKNPLKLDDDMDYVERIVEHAFDVDSQLTLLIKFFGEETQREDQARWKRAEDLAKEGSRELVVEYLVDNQGQGDGDLDAYLVANKSEPALPHAVFHTFLHFAFFSRACRVAEQPACPELPQAEGRGAGQGGRGAQESQGSTGQGGFQEGEAAGGPEGGSKGRGEEGEPVGAVACGLCVHFHCAWCFPRGRKIRIQSLRNPRKSPRTRPRARKPRSSKKKKSVDGCDRKRK